jgi:hypothetical protein
VKRIATEASGARSGSSMSSVPSQRVVGGVRDHRPIAASSPSGRSAATSDVGLHVLVETFRI